MPDRFNRAVYEVHYRGLLVCRGRIEDVAEALFVSVGTARRYVSTQPRKLLDVRKVPVVYRAEDGENTIIGTCEEVASAIGVTPSYVRQCCQRESPCVGYRIVRYPRKKYMMNVTQRVRLLNGERGGA